MEFSRPELHDPHPTEEWEIWYVDTFDRDAPAGLEVRGRGLVAGLAELWARHFFETVTADDQPGFSSFQLYRKQGRIDIHGDWEGAKRLRHWLFGTKETAHKGYVAEAHLSLLTTLAHVHARLVDREQSAEQILTLAAGAPNRQDFEDILYSLLEN